MIANTYKTVPAVKQQEYIQMKNQQYNCKTTKIVIAQPMKKEKSQQQKQVQQNLICHYSSDESILQRLCRFFRLPATVSSLDES